MIDGCLEGREMRCSAMLLEIKNWFLHFLTSNLNVNLINSDLKEPNLDLNLACFAAHCSSHSHFEFIAGEMKCDFTEALDLRP